MTHGAHFIVNTAQNGNGPLLNPHPALAGDREPVQSAGTSAGAATDHQHHVWPWQTRGSGPHPPATAAGTATAAHRVARSSPPARSGLAERANNRLGPEYPSQPY